MKIIVKPASTLPQILTYKKVAAYCRVSTLQEIQHYSLIAQQQYYEQLIRTHPGWIFAGIYTDQASGRHNLKMRDFQRMMEDCRNGHIDLILVKSISRMARNLSRIIFTKIIKCKNGLTFNICSSIHFKFIIQKLLVT